MELLDYLRLLRRRALYLVIALVAGLVGGLSVASSKTPVYSSTLQLRVATAVTDSTSLLSTLSVIAESSPTIAAAEKKAGTSNISGLTAGQVGSASVLEVTVTSGDARSAESVANAYATVLNTAYQSGGADASVKLTYLGQTTGTTALHKTRTIIIGALLGLIVGFAAALLREGLDRSVRNPLELADILSTTLQGVVPADRTSSGVVTVSHPRSARAEAYRRISASLRLAPGIDTPIRSLLITSAYSREGKTTMAVNLAAAAASAGERVVVVDADLRRPAVNAVLQYEVAPGLTDVLDGRATLAEALTSAGEFGFEALMAGSTVSRPVELLRSRAFTELIAGLRSTYDLTIIDAPAALGVADAEVLGATSDVVIFVSRLGSTPRSSIKEAMTVVRRGGAHVWGVVATFASESEPIPKIGRLSRSRRGHDWEPAGSEVVRFEPAAVSASTGPSGTERNAGSSAGAAREQPVATVPLSADERGQADAAQTVVPEPVVPEPAAADPVVPEAATSEPEAAEGATPEVAQAPDQETEAVQTEEAPAEPGATVREDVGPAEPQKEPEVVETETAAEAAPQEPAAPSGVSEQLFDQSEPDAGSAAEGHPVPGVPVDQAAVGDARGEWPSEQRAAHPEPVPTQTPEPAQPPVMGIIKIGGNQIADAEAAVPSASAEADGSSGARGRARRRRGRHGDNGSPNGSTNGNGSMNGSDTDGGTTTPLLNGAGSHHPDQGEAQAAAQDPSTA